MTSAPQRVLRDGRPVPLVGLGTWPLDDIQAEAVVANAISLGYRHIDTATRYGNERGVGAGIARSGASRDELFVTTKLDGVFQGGGRARTGLYQALDRLRLDHVDLLLIHWPLPARGLFVDTWGTFRELRDEGVASSIGVSNFEVNHLDALMSVAPDDLPAVNQVQISPYVPRRALREWHRVHGIATAAWSPLGGSGAESWTPRTATAATLLDEPTLMRIAERAERTPAQVVLRWEIQQGIIPLPKSTSTARLRSNLDVFGWDLTDEDMHAIDRLEIPGAGVDSAIEGH